MRSFAVCCLSLLLINPVFAAVKKANFSGTWTINKEKTTEPEGQHRMTIEKMVVTQDTATLTVERFFKRQTGEESSSKETYLLNGKESENTSYNNRVKKSTVQWSADGSSLTISSKSTYERDGNTVEATSVEIYTLEEKGTLLAINSTSTSPRGERKAVYYYTKQAVPAAPAVPAK